MSPAAPWSSPAIHSTLPVPGAEHVEGRRRVAALDGGRELGDRPAVAVHVAQHDDAGRDG